RELQEEIRLLRREVQQLREQRFPGPPHDRFGFNGPPRDGERGPRAGDRPRDGERPPRDGGRPRAGGRPDGERPPFPGDGERGPRGADRPRDGERPPRDGDRPQPPEKPEEPAV
ncbi:MAG: hypothetical protein KDA79_16335, partial [Planctomycetaceae bacterium]|nr:hypothetical protein [Planctomycetaceae bacterium]